MTSQDEVERTAVIICGAGPTGALLSAMLGQMQVPNIVLERGKEIETDPRGIALDEDGIRCIQDIGMYDRIFPQIAHCQNIAFIAGPRKNLWKTPFLFQDLGTSNGHTAHPAVIFHKQPRLERAIRDVIDQAPSSQMRLGCTVQSVFESDNEVAVEYENSAGETKKLSADYLVGCDGKTGFVRKKYLEPRGITLDRSPGINYDETWIAINWHIRDLPTPETHPHFPLWKLHYSPEQVYDAFFPQEFRFICNPLRPAVCGRFGLMSDRLWRFEFVVRAGEDPREMSTVAATNEIILPYLTHPGSWYGWKESIQFPMDCVDVLRTGPFTFLARACNRWSLGRTMLAGDAAHQFPPFGGQGIASGFRDVTSLAWRLAHLHHDPRVDREKLLQAWYSEREQQLQQSLAATVRNGEFLNNTGVIQSFVRDWVVWSLQQVPYLREIIQQGRRPTPRYKYEERFPFRADLGGGILLPQVFCRRLDRPAGDVQFTDDLIFDRAKDGLLKLVIFLDTASDIGPARADVKSIEQECEGLIKDGEETIIVNDLGASYAPDLEGCVARIASADEFTRSRQSSQSQPSPKLYDEMRIKKDLRPRAKYVLMRRDRYVYAACVDQEELRSALHSLPEALALPALTKARL